MSQNTMISVGVGLVAAAVGFFTFGTGTVATLALFSAGMTVASLALGPEQAKGQSAPRPDEFQMNQSAEDITVPVIFGTSRVAANFIRVDFDQFESKAVYQESQGGKGGGGGDRQQVGYTYTVPISYGLCMGPVDRLRRIVGSPGLHVFKKFSGDGLDFPTDEAETFVCEYTKSEGESEYKEGGTCHFYPGSATQGSNAATADVNHRHFCWVDFPSYFMTGSASPRSLLFEITRIPKVLDDDGNPISGFARRAGADDTEPEYYDANPAAVAWEVLQNPVWGNGTSVADMDVESFKTASQYYRNHRIGISTAMGRTSVNEFMGRLRDIFGLWVWWDGEKMRCRCIHDRTSAYSPRTRLTSEDVIGTPNFNRPGLSGTFNELRLEFTNRESNWSRQVATAMDLAHVETVGGVRTQSVDAAEIGTRRAAEKIAHQMLKAMAYPGAACTVKLRRTYSGLQPGSFVELAWDEWRETGVATTYWRVMSVEDDDQGTEGLTVNMAEDIYATAKDGTGDFEEPTPTIDEDEALETSDLNDGDLFGDRTPGSLSPVTIWEPNSWASQNTRAVMIAPTREKAYVQSVALTWRKLGDSQVTTLPATKVLPINGKLTSAIAASGPLMSRTTAGEFTIELHHAADAGRFVAATGLVQTDGDHFAELLRSLQAVALIDGEIFRIGNAEETSPGIITVRTYMRGELGSVRAAHAIDSEVVFFANFSAAAFTDASGIPTTTKVVFGLKPNSTVSQTSDDEVATLEAPEDGLGILLGGNSLKPLPPELLSATRAGTTWTVKIRPRLSTAGAGYKANLEDDLNAFVTDLAGLQLRLQKVSGGSDVIVPAGTSYATPPFTMPSGISLDSLAWAADNGTATGGILTLVVTFDANPASLNLWTVRNSYQNATPLNIPQP